MTEQETADDYIGKPFDNHDEKILGYWVKSVDVPDLDDEYDGNEALLMCANCASPKDALRAQSQIPDQMPFGTEMPYPTCDYCNGTMHPESVEGVDRAEVVELYESDQQRE